ncbi:MAG TPA: helix-turn-helix domain-containing protein, partial [Ktedonobacterales bacterium]
MGSEARMTNAVASARLTRGWTQQRLASVTQVSRQTIIAIEKGDYEPSTSLSLKLALALGVAVEDLFA